MWGKKKEKINVDLDWSILDKAKPYSPASKNRCYVLQRNITSFSLQRMLKKRNELVTRYRHENKFYLANHEVIPPYFVV